MKYYMRQYMLFFAFSFGLWQFWMCICSQINLMNEFYKKSAFAIFSLIANIASLLNGFLIERIQKIISLRSISIIWFWLNILLMFSVIPQCWIPNYELRFGAMAASIFASCFSCAAMNSILMSCSARLDPILSQAQIFGIGSASLAIQLLEDLLQYLLPSSIAQNLSQNAMVLFSIGALLLSISYFAFLQLKKLHPEAFDIQKIEQKSIQPDRIFEEKLSGDVPIASNIENPKRSIQSRLLFLGISNMLSCFCGSIMYPLFILQIPSQNHQSELWLQLIMSIMSASGLAARILPIIKPLMKPFSAKAFAFIALFRASLGLIFPLICLPKCYNGECRPIFMSDAIALAACGMFSFLGMFSYLGAMMKFQDLLDSKEENAKGSYVMNKFIQIGGISGAICSMFLIRILQ